MMRSACFQKTKIQKEFTVDLSDSDDDDVDMHDKFLVDNDLDLEDLIVDEPSIAFDTKTSHGRDHADWIAVNANMKSGYKYIKTLDDLCYYVDTNHPGEELSPRHVLTYFDVLHAKVKICPDTKLPVPHYKPRIFQSWYAMYKSFWKYTLRGELDKLCPLIQANVTAWVIAGPPKTQASIFTPSELLAAMNLDP